MYAMTISSNKPTKVKKRLLIRPSAQQGEECGMPADKAHAHGQAPHQFAIAPRLEIEYPPEYAYWRLPVQCLVGNHNYNSIK